LRWEAGLVPGCVLVCPDGQMHAVACRMLFRCSQHVNVCRHLAGTLTSNGKFAMCFLASLAACFQSTCVQARPFCHGPPMQLAAEHA
jgi:hypothetical protein